MYKSAIFSPFGNVGALPFDIFAAPRYTDSTTADSGNMIYKREESRDVMQIPGGGLMPLQIIRAPSRTPGRPVPPSIGDEELTQAYLEEIRRASGLLRGPVTLGLLGLDSGVTAERSLRLGVRAASIYLASHDILITIAVPQGEKLTEGFSAQLKQYIAQRYEGFDGSIFGHPFCRSAPTAAAAMPMADIRPAARPVIKSAALEDLLKKTDAGFSETLLRLIDRAGKKDSEVYKRANIDRKLFSKIRSNPSYRPSKSTALALAFALELDLSETRDLIGRAGYSLTHANRGDIIVEYFIVNKNYDIFALNETLFAFDQPLLGGAF